MSFDRTALIEACQAHGTVARVVVARVRGSAPREVGAAMLVWRDGFSGTIGGGTLEHEAMQAARDSLRPGTRKLSRHALGPDLGQCCGGTVDLYTEVFDQARAHKLPDDLILSGEGEMPLTVARLKAEARATGVCPAPQLISGWMVEPVSHPDRHIWIWGAGHVGRALISVLAPLPDLQLSWVDITPDRFPAEVPGSVNLLPAQQPETLIPFAPVQAEHLIVTFSHDLDLALCHGLLRHEFAFAGLIGSATKWARFRSRLQALGHDQRRIVQITCPIGDPGLGKHPHAIALGVGASLLRRKQDQNVMEHSA